MLFLIFLLTSGVYLVHLISDRPFLVLSFVVLFNYSVVLGRSALCMSVHLIVYLLFVSVVSDHCYNSLVVCVCGIYSGFVLAHT